MKVVCIDELKYWLRRNQMKGHQAALLLSDLLPPKAYCQKSGFYLSLNQCTTICEWPGQPSVHLDSNRAVDIESLARLQTSVDEKIDQMR